MATLAPSPSPSAVDPSRLSPRLWAILAVVLLADVVDLMDSTITNIAAPTIVREIGGGESLVKWLGAAYALALGTLLVVGGRLGDRYGKRRLFLIGIAGFGVASVLCGVAVDPAMLVASRLLQGAFGALLIPQGFGILLAAFSREQFTSAVVAFGPVLGGSAVLGPILAGVIIDGDLAGLSWRPMFLINIVLCSVGFVLAMRLLPEDDRETFNRDPIDLPGAGLLGLGMLGLIYGLIQGSSDGWTGVAVLSLVVGAVGFVLFGVRQVRARHPLILPSLLRNRGFTSGLLLGLAYFAAVNGFAYVVSLFFQLELGLSPIRAALGLTPLMVGIIAASFLSRPLIPRLGRRLVVGGLVLTVAGVVALLVTALVAGSGITVWIMAAPVLVLGLGMGACFSSIFDVAIGDVTPDEAGSASGSLSAVQQIAAAVGSAVVTTVFFARLAHSGVRALEVSLLVVGGITLVCLGLVWLLPRKAAPEGEGH